MPVQNLFRDRVYHALTHLDALWEQDMLPLKYKIRYEKFKQQHNIGDDNIHPEHKKEKPEYNFPIPNNYSFFYRKNSFFSDRGQGSIFLLSEKSHDTAN